MSPEKPHRIRVRVCDGQPRESNQLRGRLAPHMDFIDVKDGLEFVICALKEAHIEKVRAKLTQAGLEEIPGSDTTLPAAPRYVWRKPYGFLPVPDPFTAAPPIWHDGTASAGCLSGELRCEIETLTPLLVGWERRRIDDPGEPWPIPFEPVSVGKEQVTLHIGERRLRTVRSKCVLYPLRAPWEARPVLLSGDSIKGLLRHELGALLGAPMERVAERSYSYRPNSLHPNRPNPRLIPRLARVPDGGVEMRNLETGVEVRVPVQLDLLPEDLRYDDSVDGEPPRYQFDPPHGGASYRGGIGAGEELNAKRRLHHRLEADPDHPVTRVTVPPKVQDGYLNTLRHLTDLRHGHFSDRHPDVPQTIEGKAARRRIREAAANDVFSPGDLIWVEWDTRDQCIVSLGWHYYYRWAYTDTVRRKGWTEDRRELIPLPDEKQLDGCPEDKHRPPHALSPIRRLFGYTAENNPWTKGLGRGDHEQLMGRVAVNAAIEVVANGDTDDRRFLPPTFLRELGRPRPTAVEHYLEQPYHPQSRPSDPATLTTYGDAMGYDEPGRLAGRKFYLDRSDAYTEEPWKDDSEANRLSPRSTLALEASRPGRRFRFTVRFRDLDPKELATLLLALGPHQFRDDVEGKHPEGYCTKIGYARPLGWGTVRIEVKEMHFLAEGGIAPELQPHADIRDWFKENFQTTPALPAWLDLHRHKHPDAADYPQDRDGKTQGFHSALRTQHTRLRRYDPESRR